MTRDVDTSEPEASLVGRYLLKGEAQFFPSNPVELRRIGDSIGEVIDSFGSLTGRYALVISMIEEAVQFVPFELAVIARRMIVTNADASIYEGGRVEAILRRFDVPLVLGVNAAILASLRGAGHDPIKLFAGRTVWAVPSGYDELKGHDQDFRLLRWMEFGPAVGLECIEAAGVHVSSMEWLLDEEDGEIVLTSRLPRCLPADRLHTGVRGTVVRTACACGSRDFRILV